MHATSPGKFDNTAIATIHLIKSHDKKTVMFKLKQSNQSQKFTTQWDGSP